MMVRSDIQALRDTAAIHLPGDSLSEERVYSFLSPWLFVRRDLFKRIWRDPWYREKFGFSQSRLFRDSWIRPAQTVTLPTEVDCIFAKRSSVRYFDRSKGEVRKVLISDDPATLEGLARDLRMREEFAGAVPTIPVLDSGRDFLVEPISSGRRVLEQELLRKPAICKQLTETALAIAGAQGVETIDGFVTAASHGDFQIHNLFWDPQKGVFTVIDWERAGRNPILWDSVLFCILLLNKNAVRRSRSLLRRFDHFGSEHFGRLAEVHQLDHCQRLKQWKECEARFHTTFGGEERRRYGGVWVDEKLRRVKNCICP